MDANLSYLYSKKSELEEKKNKYIAALGIIGNIGNALFEYGQKLSGIRDNLYSSFTIGGMTADGGKIEMLISSVGEIHNFYVGTLASQIDTELTQLENQISDCEYNIGVELAKQKEANNK